MCYCPNGTIKIIFSVLPVDILSTKKNFLSICHSFALSQVFMRIGANSCALQDRTMIRGTTLGQNMYKAGLDSAVQVEMGVLAKFGHLVPNAKIGI